MEPEGEDHGKSKPPVRVLGRGEIIHRGKDVVYKGTLPFNDKSRVAIIDEKDLELLVRGTLSHLFMNKGRMADASFENFPDSIDYVNPKTNEETKLYLDRHWYTLHPERQIVIRYVSIDEAEDEGEFNDAGDTHR